MMGAVTAMMIVLGAVAYNLEGGLFTIFGHWSPRMDALHNSIVRRYLLAVNLDPSSSLIG